MDLGRLSIRWKFTLPAAVAAAATLLAMAIVGALMERAAERIALVEARDFPALELSQALEDDLAALQRQLQDAAAAEDLSMLEDADARAEALVERIRGSPEAVLDAKRRETLAAELEGYAALARDVTGRMIRKDRGEEALRGLGEMTARYTALREGLEADTRRSRAAMSEAFGATARLQRTALLAVIGLLLAAAGGALALSAALARSAARPLEALRIATARVAEGDLTAEVQVTGRDEVGQVAEGFARMVAGLREIVGTLKAAAAELGAAAEGLRAHTGSQAALVQQQAQAVAETTATMTELQHVASVASARAGAVLEVATRAAKVSGSGREAVERSVAGIGRIQATVATVVGESTRLVERARQIGPIVDTVKDLASMSTVLSLNASIEAARAGEAGRGFGVVASEVRALADQSVQSAVGIQKIVRDILQAAQAALASTEEGTRGIEGAVAEVRASGESLGEVGSIVAETGDAARDIARAVQEQSAGIAQIAHAMADLDKGMADTVKRLQALRASAEGLAGTASRISAVADGFRV
jgi:methyl-accepting chemotaxis protein